MPSIPRTTIPFVANPSKSLNTITLATQAQNQGLLWGCSIASASFPDTDYLKFVVNEIQNGGIATSEAAFDEINVMPASGVFNYTGADQEFRQTLNCNAKYQGRIINGTNRNPPGWYTTINTSASAAGVLSSLVRNSVTRYLPAGFPSESSLGIYSWLVVKDAVGPTGGDSNGLQTNAFYSNLASSSAYIASAFNIARSINPGVILLYEQSGLEVSSTNGLITRGYTYQLLKNLLASGTPVNGLAMPAHLTGSTFARDFNALDMTAFLNAVGGLGINIYIMDLDIFDDTTPGNPPGSSIPVRDNTNSNVVSQFMSVVLANQYVVGLMNSSLSNRDNRLNRFTIGTRPDNYTLRTSPLDWTYANTGMYTAVGNVFSDACYIWSSSNASCSTIVGLNTASFVGVGSCSIFATRRSPLLVISSSVTCSGNITVGAVTGTQIDFVSSSIGGVFVTTFTPPTAALSTYGSLIFATDHMTAVKTAINAGNAPYSGAFSALNQLANTYPNWTSQRSAVSNAVSTQAGGQATPANTLSVPGFFQLQNAGDSALGLNVEQLLGEDTTAVLSHAIVGYLSNQNSPSAINTIRDWITGSQIINNYIVGVGGQDAPLEANTYLNGIAIGAILLDEALQGNWPAAAQSVGNPNGWSATDRVNAENWMINPWYSSSQIIIGQVPGGNAFQQNMPNNWRSWALHTQALVGFYLLGSTSASRVTQGQQIISGAAAEIAAYITGTNANGNSSGQTANIVQQSGSIGGFFVNTGELYQEDLRGNHALNYQMFSQTPLMGAIQVIAAAGGPNLFALYSGSVNSGSVQIGQMLMTAYNHLNPFPPTNVFMSCYGSNPNGNPPSTGSQAEPSSGPSLMEAMGAIYSSSLFTNYAISAGRPIWSYQLNNGGTSGYLQHSNLYTFSTLTNLLNPPGAQPANFIPSLAHPNEPSGFLPQIDTGQITGSVTTFQSTMGTSGGQWTTFHNGITNTWTNNTGASGSGRYAPFLMLASGSGFRQRYDQQMQAGGNYVTFDTPIPVSGSGGIYISAMIRFLNWSNNGTPGVVGTNGPKLFEPRCGGPNNGGGQENHVCGVFPEVGSAAQGNYAWFNKQINSGPQDCTGGGGCNPPGSFLNLPNNDQSGFVSMQSQYPLLTVTDASQSYVQAEWIITQESIADQTQDARVLVFVNGVKGFDSAQSGIGAGLSGSLRLLAANSIRGWFFLTFNSVFGGAGIPQQIQYYDIDQIYVSVSPPYLSGTPSVYAQAATNWTGSH